MSIAPKGNTKARGATGGPTSEPAAPYRFEVVVDGITLGSFTSCDGLAAEYEVHPYQEGGANHYVHKLPGRLTFPHVKLSRALDGGSSGTLSLAGWFSKLDQGIGRKLVSRTVGITAYTSGGKKVATWSLHGAVPVKWTGPNFSSDGTGAAKETLEFAHQGFM
ncbi:MAG: conserved hypothetical phage tail protein [Actinomycetia bacterium]|jgi:phage tail-like protein|nr:conserved hypothetical phage tail protein [Actinomycetes bacterium]